ncbi:hypothetical protein PCASD_00067 [Puccinia coronata f. sp. avenae]|uniref:Uncharacterized protein n=1 Tax=Puccinia coronata f. sp. avenae TaxID=200324 RepID=A0A2N5VR14_9BASI|nr:hypothetical protein PCASD_00067 [Puccinia coronata f. sp. avenae]
MSPPHFVSSPHPPPTPTPAALAPCSTSHPNHPNHPTRNTTMDLEICTCPLCIQQTTTSTNGKTTKGRWIHPSPSRRHWTQATTPLDDLCKISSALPSTSPPPHISPPSNTSPLTQSDSQQAKTITEPE